MQEINGDALSQYHAPQAAPEPGPLPLHLTTRSFCGILFKHKAKMLGFFALVVAPVAGFSIVREVSPTYEATAKVIVEQQESDEKRLLLGMLQQSQEDWMVREMEVIDSYPVLERVVGSVGVGRLVPPDVARRERSRLLDEAVEEISENLVLERAEDSSVLLVSYADADPALAAAVVNAVIQHYLDYRVELDDQARHYRFIEEQLHLTDERLSELEEEQVALEQKDQPIEREDRYQLLLTRLQELDKAYATARLQRDKLDDRVARLRQWSREGGEAFPLGPEDGSAYAANIVRLNAALLELEMQREGLVGVVASSYEGRDNLDQQITLIKGQIRRQQALAVAEEESKLRLLDGEVQVTAAAIDQVTQELHGVVDGSHELERARLARGIEHHSEVYAMLLKQQEEARISLSRRDGSVQVKVISAALVPSKPRPSNAVRNTLISVCLGLAVSLGAVFLAESASHTIDSPVVLQRVTGVAVLGTLGDYATQTGLRPARRELLPPAGSDAGPLPAGSGPCRGPMRLRKPTDPISRHDPAAATSPAAAASTPERLAADLAAMERLHGISTRFGRLGDVGALLQETVDAAVEITGADMGSIQLFDPESDALRIVAHRGFDQPFLDYFGIVRRNEAASGTALERGERVIIEDVARGPVFAGTPALGVVLAAGVRAVQSSPLCTHSGQLVGMLSTHYRTVRRPDEHDLRLLDLLVRTAADLVERSAGEEALRQSEERLRLAQQAGQVGIFDRDIRRRRSHWNDVLYAIYGLQPGDMPNPFDGWIERVHPQDRQGVEAHLSQAMALGAAQMEAEHRIVRPDGQVRWVATRGIITYDGAGQPVRMLGASLDVTERKQAEESLRRSRDELEQRVAERTALLEERARQLGRLAS
ncbi:MAG: PAS domain-containing protein [Candidatus Latescibacterota bacterium]